MGHAVKLTFPGYLDILNPFEFDYTDPDASEYIQKPFMFGKQHSEETKILIGKAQLGRTHSKETKEKRSKSLKGFKPSQQALQNMSIAQSKRFNTEEGRLHQKMASKKANENYSVERKQKVSKALKGYKHPMEFGNSIKARRIGTKRVYREDGSWTWGTP